MPAYEIVGPRTVRDQAGVEYDVLEAIAALAWVKQLCPLMPHEYAVSPRLLGRGPTDSAWDVVATMVGPSNPASYRAYFRAYATANRYWEAPDGMRYWRTRELNRCEPESVEPLRLVAAGAKPIKDWDGPRWAPDGIGLYYPDPRQNGKWWPTAAALSAGFRACRACSVTHPREANG